MLYTLLKDQFYVKNGVICPIANDAVSVFDETHREGNLTKIIRTIRNETTSEISLIPCLSVQISRTEATQIEWFVPSVSYSGNTFGDGMEQKGWHLEGEPWIFPSDHAGVPGCTVTMSEHGCFALFLSTDAVASASSLEILEDSVVQRAYFTHIEYPKAYLEKFRYGDAILETISLMPCESKTWEGYLFFDEEKGVFGYRKWIEYLINHYARTPIKRVTPEIYEYSMSFLRSLIQKTEYFTLTNMGYLPRIKADGSGKEFVYRSSGRYECGWCGQNISHAWLLLFDHMKKQDGFSLTQKTALAPFDISFAVEGTFDLSSEDYQNAIGILDSWKQYRFSNGLIPVLLDDLFKKKESFTLDLCNLGWLVYQYVNSYILLKQGGVVREDYLSVAKDVLDVVIHEDLRAKGFPQMVNEKGDILCDRGMAGAMMTVAALQAYRATNEERYFEAGRSSFDFYYEEYLSKNAAAGAALDTYCIDKESAGPVLRAALMLHRLTGDDAYLKKAENIACYLQTWMFYYDIPFPKGTDADNTGFTTLGATAVSAQHRHLDCWASYYAPDLRYLAAMTGNATWQRASDYLREYTFQGISDGKTELHGLLRPAGAQNEAIFQSNWSFDGKHEKGQFNDWLVSWVNAFRLMDMNHEELSSM